MDKIRRWAAWAMLKAAGAVYPHSRQPVSTAGALSPPPGDLNCRCVVYPSTAALAAANLRKEIDRRLVDDIFQDDATP